jgi:DNA-binding transcriptional ArsR family regulator
LLGGNRKRLIVERLSESGGYSASQLIDELKIGRTTVFEALRVLRGAHALDQLADDRYRLTRRTPLGRALRALVFALATSGDDRVERPPRPRRPRRHPSRRPRRRR